MVEIKARPKRSRFNATDDGKGVGIVHHPTLSCQSCSDTAGNGGHAPGNSQHAVMNAQEIAEEGSGDESSQTVYGELKSREVGVVHHRPIEHLLSEEQTSAPT